MEIDKRDSIDIDVKITMCGDKIEEKIRHIKIWCGWYLDRLLQLGIKDQSVEIECISLLKKCFELEVTF